MPARTRKNLNLALVGSAGRMGKEVLALAEELDHFKIKALINSGQDWKAVDSSQIDVVLDFSQPPGLRQALRWCVRHRCPLVSGTTGLTTADQRSLRAAAKHLGILHSANMSLGVARMRQMLAQLKDLPQSWDFQVHEIHHRHKKDRPSGTALRLQADLNKVVGRKLPAPHSTRGGSVPGIHEVWAMGPDEALVLQHTAFHRRVFAHGALAAAAWLFDKAKPGLYDLSDLYNS